jgi:hypothetical protein
MAKRDVGDFSEFAVAARGQMRRTAYLLCGDWHRAADITQGHRIQLGRHLPRGAAVLAVCYDKQFRVDKLCKMKQGRHAPEGRGLQVTDLRELPGLGCFDELTRQPVVKPPIPG